MSTAKRSRAPGSLPCAPMSPTPIEDSHAELAALGERIRKHDAETAAIDRDLAAAIERARMARLTMDEIANQTGVSRPTLYSSLRRAKEQAAKGRPGARRTNAPRS
jgi:DNA-directed RNA polymerase specialized sigma24 family protein